MLSIPALLLLAAFQPETAPREDEWIKAAKKAGTALVLVTREGEVHKGKLVKWTPEEISLGEKEAVAVDRQTIAVIRAADAFGNFHTVYAPWENVAGIQIGDKVRVVKKNLVLVDGELVNRSEQGITIRQWNHNVLVPRDKISKVRVIFKSQEKLGAEIGSAVTLLGIIALAIAAGGAGAQMADVEGDQLTGVAMLGGEAGKFVGSWFNQYQTVYIAPRK